MSLFGAFFGDLNDDPYFSGHMRQMNQMSQMMDPFGGMFNMFGGGGRVRSGGNAIMPMGMGFPDMNSIMDNFKMGMDNGNCHSFSSSTMMTMSSGPDGRPQVYRESQSTRCAPGGIKETKKAVHDSRSGTKRMAIGHHIGERGHVREKVHNYHSGELEESDDFINLEEDEAEDFNREWTHKTHSVNRHSALGYREDNRRQRALPAAASASASHSPSSRYRSRPSAISAPSSYRRSYPALTHSNSSSVEITELTDEEPEEEPKKVEKSRKRPRVDPSGASSGSKLNKHQ